MDTRLSQNSTALTSYRDYLAKQGQDELDALAKEQQAGSQIAQQAQSATQSAGSSLADFANAQNQNFINKASTLLPPPEYGNSNGNPAYQLAGGQGSILSQSGPITETYGESQPGVEVFSHGFTNGTGIGVPTGTKVALPPGQWEVLQSYSGDQTPGHIGDGTNSGYGNSAFVENLQTGEKLRFSHLSKNGAQAGSILPGGTIFGETGATGNVTGPHLNLEYYNQKGQLDNVLHSPYAPYLGVGQGNSKGKGGGNPVMDAMSRLTSGVKQAGQDFEQGYMAGPNDGIYGEYNAPRSIGNFLANGTPAGEGGQLVGKIAGSVVPHLGQAAHALSAVPLMAGTIKFGGKIAPQDMPDFLDTMKRYQTGMSDMNYAMSPNAQYDQQALTHYGQQLLGNKATKMPFLQLQPYLQAHYNAQTQNFDIPHINLQKNQ